MPYELEPLTDRAAEQWDELISRYPSRRLFHQRVWLDYLAASQDVDVRLWAICDHGRTVGYFCSGVLRKGPFVVLGSPLRGWGTNFMGPVVNSDFDQLAFLSAIDDLANRERYAIVEMESPLLSDRHFRRLGFEPVPSRFYDVSVTPGQPERMWSRLEPQVRTKVRKARRHGLTVEDTSDPAVADEFYDQFVEVLARKKLFPPYDLRCPRLLFDSLKPADLLFALRVRDPDGSVVATALYPHDDRTVYGWGRGSRIAAWHLGANDLLQWAAVELAAARGLVGYNTSTYGYFMSKFGGTLITSIRWHKCYWHTARWARRLYESYVTRRIRFRGLLQHIAQRSAGASVVFNNKAGSRQRQVMSPGREPASPPLGAPRPFEGSRRPKPQRPVNRG